MGSFPAAAASPHSDRLPPDRSRLARHQPGGKPKRFACPCGPGLALRRWLRLDASGPEGITVMRVLSVVALAAALCGCAIQRAQVAQDARVQMVGMSKEQVLACMGPPASKAAEAQTEVWGYNSGDGTVVASGSVSGGNFSGVSSSRFCKINMVFAGGAVSAVNYQGPTGGLITAGEQCAYAVDASVKPHQLVERG
jgi:hypothetical protein